MEVFQRNYETKQESSFVAQYLLFLQKFRHIQYDIVVNKTNNETVLKLWNISHIYVGYYYCIKVIRDEKKEYDLNAMMLEEGVDKIYLFVKGCHSIYLNS